MPPSNLRSVVAQMYNRGGPRRNFSSSLGSRNGLEKKKDHVVLKWSLGGYLSYLVLETIKPPLKQLLGYNRVSQGQVTKVNAAQRYE